MIGIDEQIRAVQREIAMRGNVFGKRVAAGRMTRAEADKEIANMQAVLETLERVKQSEQLI